MLRSAFEIAVEKEWIDRNPFKHFEKTRQMTKLPRAYSPADYSSYRSKAAEVYGEDFAIVLDLYLLLGLRDGEGTMLEWEYFDLELGILNVPPEITKALHERIVPLPQYAVQILKVLKAKGHSRPIDFNASTLSHRWIKLRRGGRYKGKDFVGTGIPGTFHNLRKSTVTYLKKAGLNPDFIDIMVGHRRKGVSAENYTDYELSLDVVRDHLEKVAGIFFPGNSARNVKTETTSSLTEYGGLRLVRIVRA
jgi:integrase